MRVWLLVASVAVTAVAVKATGPVLLGGRQLPSRMTRMLGLLAPSLLAGLVVTQVFSRGQHLVLDARAAGLAAAGIALLLRAPVIAVMAAAAAVTVLWRAVG